MTTFLYKSVVGPQSLGTSTCSLISKFKKNLLISKPWELQHRQVGGGVLVKDMKALKSTSIFHKGFYIHASKEISPPDEEKLILTKVSNEVSLIDAPTSLLLMLRDGTSIRTKFASQNHLQKSQNHLQKSQNHLQKSQNHLQKSQNDEYLVKYAILLRDVNDQRKLIPIIGRSHEVSMVKRSFVTNGVTLGIKKEFANELWNSIPTRVIIGMTLENNYKAKIVYTKFREITEVESYTHSEVETNSLKVVGEISEDAQSPFAAIALALVVDIPIYVTREFMETYGLCIMNEVELTKIKNTSLKNLKSKGKPTTNESEDQLHQISREERNFAEVQLMIAYLRLSIALEEDRNEDAKLWQYEYDDQKGLLERFNKN